MAIGKPLVAAAALSFVVVSTSIGAIKGGRVRAIAMTGDKRFELMPELPTIAPAGVPGFEVRNWYGVFVPVGTSKEIVARLNSELLKILQMPGVKAKLPDERHNVFP